MKQMDWHSHRDNYPVTKERTYLKSASISGVHNRVLKAIEKWQASIAHDAAVGEERFFDLLQESKEVISSFLGAHPEDVALTENTSHNMNVIAMMLKTERDRGQNEIVVPADEFPSSLLPFYHHGFKVKLIPCPKGVVKEEDLIAALTDKTAALITSHVMFSTGFRLDLPMLSKACEESNIPFIVNTTQSLGVFPVNVKELKVAALTSSCHKWLGAGIGQAILYLNPEWRTDRPYPLIGWCSVEEPFAMKNDPPELRNDVGVLQLGSLPFPLIAGVTEAIRVVREIGLEPISTRVLNLSQKLRKGLENLGYEPLGSGEPQRSSGIVTFSVQEPEDFMAFMESKKVYVNNRRGLIRASVHHYNNEADVDFFLKAIDIYDSKRRR